MMKNIKKISKLLDRSYPELDPNPITDLDKDCRVLYTNPSARRFLPKTSSAMRKSSWCGEWDDLLKSLTVNSQKPLVRKVKVGNRHFEQSIFYLDGMGIIRIYGADITDLMRYTEDLYDSKKRLEALMDALPVGVSFSHDKEFKQVSGNPALLRQLELPRGANISASTPDAKAPGMIIRYFRQGREITAKDLPMQRAVAENRYIEPIEIEAVMPSGKHWFMEASGVPIRDREGRIIGSVAVNVDITERKKLEAMTEQRRQLEESRRKSEFIADATHELRTPLAIIKGNVDLFLKYNKSGIVPIEETFMAIDNEVNHMSELLSDLSLLTRESFEFKRRLINKKFNLARLIQRVIRRSRYLTYKKKIRIVTKKVPSVELLGDEGYMEKLFLNLVKNAISYGKNKGTVCISGKIDEDTVSICVQDDGIGIAKEHLPHIFKRFYRADKARTRGKGRTGLGLAIARWIAEAHDGVITVKSHLDKGSTFTLTLPIRQND